MTRDAHGPPPASPGGETADSVHGEGPAHARVESGLLAGAVGQHLSGPTRLEPTRRVERAAVLGIAVLGVALARPPSLAAQPGPDAPPRAVAAHYWAALLRADTAGARAVSNGLPPLDMQLLDSLEVDEAEALDPCPELPSIPDSLRSPDSREPAADSALSDAERRRLREARELLDSAAAAMDSLFGDMRGADSCVQVPTRLMIVDEGASEPDVTVAFSTVLRELPAGWRIDALSTQRNALLAWTSTMGDLLRNLGEVLEEAGPDSADRDSVPPDPGS